MPAASNVTWHCSFPITFLLLLSSTCTWNQWICTPKPYIFETVLQSGLFLKPTGLGNSCGRLKQDIFEVHYVKNLGPVLTETFKFKMADDNGLFATLLALITRLIAYVEIILFILTTTISHSKRRLSLIQIVKSLSCRRRRHVFQKSGNQGNTWHKAELTYRKGISSVRIQQEAKAYVYVAWGVAHDIATSALMWQNKTHFVLINKNVRRENKEKLTTIWPISSHLDRTSLISGANIHESTETSVFFRASYTRKQSL